VGVLRERLQESGRAMRAVRSTSIAFASALERNSSSSMIWLSRATSSNCTCTDSRLRHRASPDTSSFSGVQAHQGQRRLQLVRGLGREAAGPGRRDLEPVEHLVQQPCELRRSRPHVLDRDALLQVVGADAVGGVADRRDRCHSTMRLKPKPMPSAAAGSQRSSADADLEVPVEDVVHRRGGRRDHHVEGGQAGISAAQLAEVGTCAVNACRAEKSGIACPRRLLDLKNRLRLRRVHVDVEERGPASVVVADPLLDDRAA
jgi:hypothetical protein